MDFTLTEAQRDLASLTRRILTDKVTPEVLGPHGSGGFDAPLWTSLAQAGVLDAALPQSVGGGGFGLLEQCSVLAEIGRAVAPVPYLTSVVMGAAAVAEFGDGQLAERWIVPVLRGDHVLAVALPDYGVPCGFTAEADGDGWRLTGAQTAVASGAFAHGFLVEAAIDGGRQVFLLDRDAATVSPQRTVDHADAALVELSGAKATASLGDVGEWLRLRGTVGVCAQQLGVVERALELTAAYARERKQFGHLIGSFQAVRQRLADAYVDVEAVRLTLWQAAWRLSEGLPAAEEVATAKFWAAEAGHRVAHTAVHIHGGVGIDVDHTLHRYFVAAKRLEFTLGGATAQLGGLGDLLAAAPA
ncbi:acyl-CoA dehydrogenase family protein [Amycolatopsis keratiniphila]|uniref:Acyl-CoA dehydrogenase n=1 Tax=Amycolatopsis keratiniphila subsp. keratiniphila TaxID=227715 RepID=A0A1W2LXL7_9PSEU|nr:acyl-CoA dehydrogenase family protein [Amycolatopsis keratiniphila]OLZ48628.1 acyl-CoA dehydrogenase [Amycolatopsis keratiniphila subsp. nogabecina]ONF71585.1 acyl-CoA dehydrogenase [Amycolatopsis keratiniphila subsp. keratiniphila]SDU36014.1 Acyl-CoA dehydrogenase [Amycolatopsis keratiniphila]